MWRQKDGFERRFEIQRLDEYEREEKEKEIERERDGESYQGWNIVIFNYKTFYKCINRDNSFVGTHYCGNRSTLEAEPHVLWGRARRRARSSRAEHRTEEEH